MAPPGERQPLIFQSLKTKKNDFLKPELRAVSMATGNISIWVLANYAALCLICALEILLLSN